MTGREFGSASNIGNDHCFSRCRNSEFEVIWTNGDYISYKTYMTWILPIIQNMPGLEVGKEAKYDNLVGKIK